MSNREPRVQPGWDYANAETAALALEELLARHGIRIAPGSVFERDVLQVMKLVQQKQLGVPEVGHDVRADYRTLIGVYDLATLILEAEQSPSFPALVPHLRLLNEGSILQNAPSPGSDQAADKIFELFVATLAIQCGTDIEVDDPVSSRGDGGGVTASAVELFELLRTALGVAA
jgi:hypothetical protein